MKNNILSLYNKIVAIPYIAIIIFTVIFLFFYGPYLFMIKLPGVSSDTLQYTHFAMHIISGDIPLEYLHIDIPLGLPLFIAAILAMGGNIDTTIFIQTILFLFSCIFLIRQVDLIDKKAGFIFMLLLLFLWAIDPYIMRQNTVLIPDSLYATALVFTVAGILKYFRNKNHKSLLLIFIGIFLASIIRSNGIYLFFIPGIFIVTELILKNYKNALNNILYSFAVIILLSSFNLVLKGYFFPGDYQRIKAVTSRLIEENNESETIAIQENEKAEEVKEQRQTRSQMFVSYLTAPTRERPSFYYSFLNPRYTGYKSFNEDFLEKFRFKFPTDSIVNFLYKDHDTAYLADINFLQITDFNHKPLNIIMITHQIIYKSMYYIFHKTYLVVLSFLVLTFIAIFKTIKTMRKNKKYFYSWLIIATISLIHFLSAIVLSLAHGRVQIRYINVSEFIIYVTLLLAIIILIQKKQITKPN
jgi:hypothetical protein